MFEEPMNDEETGMLDLSLLDNIDLFSSFDKEIFTLLNDLPLSELQPHEQWVATTKPSSARNAC